MKQRACSYTDYHGNLILKDGKPQMYRFANDTTLLSFCIHFWGKDRLKKIKKLFILLLIVVFSPQYIYCQKFETETKVFDSGFGVFLDEESYPNIPLTFEIPSNYKRKYEKSVNRFAYVYKSGEIICFYSDWTRQRSWSLGVHEVDEKQANEILFIDDDDVDVNKKPWLYREDRQSVIVSLGNSVCLLFNIKKKNVERYTQLIKESFKELPKSSNPQFGTIKKQTRIWKSNSDH